MKGLDGVSGHWERLSAREVSRHPAVSVSLDPLNWLDDGLSHPPGGQLGQRDWGLVSGLHHHLSGLVNNWCDHRTLSLRHCLYSGQLSVVSLETSLVERNQREVSVQLSRLQISQHHDNYIFITERRQHKVVFSGNQKRDSLIIPHMRGSMYHKYNLQVLNINKYFRPFNSPLK